MIHSNPPYILATGYVYNENFMEEASCWSEVSSGPNLVNFLQLGQFISLWSLHFFMDKLGSLPHLVTCVSFILRY